MPKFAEGVSANGMVFDAVYALSCVLTSIVRVLAELGTFPISVIVTGDVLPVIISAPSWVSMLVDES